MLRLDNSKIVTLKFKILLFFVKVKILTKQNTKLKENLKSFEEQNEIFKKENHRLAMGLKLLKFKKINFFAVDLNFNNIRKSTHKKLLCVFFPSISRCFGRKS